MLWHYTGSTVIISFWWQALRHISGLHAAPRYPGHVSEEAGVRGSLQPRPTCDLWDYANRFLCYAISVSHVFSIRYASTTSGTGLCSYIDLWHSSTALSLRCTAHQGSWSPGQSVTLPDTCCLCSYPHRADGERRGMKGSRAAIKARWEMKVWSVCAPCFHDMHWNWNPSWPWEIHCDFLFLVSNLFSNPEFMSSRWTYNSFFHGCKKPFSPLLLPF